MQWEWMIGLIIMFKYIAGLLYPFCMTRISWTPTREVISVFPPASSNSRNGGPILLESDIRAPFKELQDHFNSHKEWHQRCMLS